MVPPPSQGAQRRSVHWLSFATPVKNLSMQRQANSLTIVRCAQSTWIPWPWSPCVLNVPRDHFCPNWSSKPAYLMCKGPGLQTGWIWGQRCPLLHGFTTLSPCYPLPPSRALSPHHTSRWVFSTGFQACAPPQPLMVLRPTQKEGWEQMVQGLEKPVRNPPQPPGALHPQLLNTPSWKSLSIYLIACQTVTEWQYALGLWIFKHVYFIWTLKKIPLSENNS